MSSPIHSKKPQTFHRTDSPQTFLNQFEPAIGCSVAELIGAFVPSSSVIASFLVGSIPLGIGSSASDIDILVLLTSADGLRLPSQTSHDGVVFAAPVAGDRTSLVAGIVATVRRSIEIDLEFVLAPSAIQLADRLSTEDPYCSAKEARILSRLKMGWVLTQTPALEGFLAHISRHAGLERFCARQHTIQMFELVEEATVMLANRPVAIQLGRLSVEAGFRAYLASNGLSAVGNKWLRFFRAHRLARSGDSIFTELVVAGMPLLFPALDGTEVDTREYLRRVEQFTRTARSAIEARFEGVLRPLPQQPPH